MKPTEFLIVPLLQGFCWFDDGLQAHLDAEGWGHVTRPQSIVMVAVLTGYNRPSEIARHLRISRQAIHATISEMVDMGIFELADDPDDRRSKIVRIAPKGAKMRKFADATVKSMTDELARRIGKANVAALAKALAADWGEPPIPAPASKKAKRR